MDKLHEPRPQNRRRNLLAKAMLTSGMLGATLAACGTGTEVTGGKPSVVTAAAERAPKPSVKLIIDTDLLTNTEVTGTKQHKGDKVTFLTIDPLVDPAKTKVYSVQAEQGEEQLVDAGTEKFYISHPIVEPADAAHKLYFVDKAGNSAYIVVDPTSELLDSRGNKITDEVVASSQESGLVGDISTSGFEVTEIVSDPKVGSHPISQQVGAVFPFKQ